MEGRLVLRDTFLWKWTAWDQSLVSWHNLQQMSSIIFVLLACWRRFLFSVRNRVRWSQNESTSFFSGTLLTWWYLQAWWSLYIATCTRIGWMFFDHSFFRLNFEKFWMCSGACEISDFATYEFFGAWGTRTTNVKFLAICWSDLITSWLVGFFFSKEARLFGAPVLSERLEVGVPRVHWPPGAKGLEPTPVFVRPRRKGKCVHTPQQSCVLISKQGVVQKKSLPLDEISCTQKNLVVSWCSFSCCKAQDPFREWLKTEKPKWMSPDEKIPVYIQKSARMGIQMQIQHASQGDG